MQLDQLRYFVAVAELGNFRRASERLHVAQPALSRQIKALEQELGVTLFERTTKGARLTPPGGTLLADARHILGLVAATAEHVARTAGTTSRSLRVAVTASPPAVVSEAILAFRTARPDVSCTLMQVDSTKQADALRERRIDAAFLHTEPRDHREFATHLVQVERMVLALPADHSLAATDAIRLRDLAPERLIHFARPVHPVMYDELAAAFAHGGLVPLNPIEVGTASPVILDLVAAGFGLGIVSTAVRNRLRDGIMLRPIEDLNFPYLLHLAWRADDTSATLAAFIRTVQLKCGQPPGVP